MTNSIIKKITPLIPFEDINGELHYISICGACTGTYSRDGKHGYTIGMDNIEVTREEQDAFEKRLFKYTKVRDSIFYEMTDGFGPIKSRKDLEHVVNELNKEYKKDYKLSFFDFDLDKYKFKLSYNVEGYSSITTIDNYGAVVTEWHAMTNMNGDTSTVNCKMILRLIDILKR